MVTKLKSKTAADGSHLEFSIFENLLNPIQAGLFLELRWLGGGEQIAPPLTSPTVTSLVLSVFL